MLVCLTFVHDACDSASPGRAGMSIAQVRRLRGAGDACYTAALHVLPGGAKMKVGFVGLGIMGSRMAARLQAAGYDLVVSNRTRAKAEPLLAAGAQWADRPSGVGRQANVLFTMLADPNCGAGRGRRRGRIPCPAQAGSDLGRLQHDEPRVRPRDGGAGRGIRHPFRRRAGDGQQGPRGRTVSSRFSPAAMRPTWTHAGTTSRRWARKSSTWVRSERASRSSSSTTTSSPRQSSPSQRRSCSASPWD